MTIATTATLCHDEGEQHSMVVPPGAETAADSAAVQVITIDYHTAQKNRRSNVGDVDIYDNDGAADDGAPVTPPDPTEQAASIVVTEMGICNNVPWAAADNTFPTWWRLVDLLRQPGGAEAFDHFVKSDRFLKGDKGQKVAGWRALFLSSMRATEPPTLVGELGDAETFTDVAALAPWPLPHAIMHVEKDIASMEMQCGQWLVCLEIRLTAHVDCEDWKDNGALLDAGVAFCEGEEDWADLLHRHIRRSLGFEW